MNGFMSFPRQPEFPQVPPPIIYVTENATWEYKQVIRNLAKEQPLGEDELNALGADGWELAGMFADSPFVYFYFKRVKE